MIWRAVKALFRVSVAQPWDYMGEGAPNEWEFRVSPDEGYVAVYDPRRGSWVLLDSGRLITVAGVSLKEMGRNTLDWARYVEELDPDGFAELERESRARGWA